MTTPVVMTPRAYETLVTLLKPHLPDTAVRAYGSRVQGQRPRAFGSDLVAFASPEQRMSIFDIKEALEQSDLPFRVDLLIWDEIPTSFHREIERDHVTLLSHEIAAPK